MTRTLITLALLCLGTNALANSACDKPRDDFDGLYCLNKVYQEADKELNENYKALVGQLDADGKAKLKKGQIGWIKERNNECSRKDDTGFYVNLSCATEKTISRAQFLKDRSRECVSSGCMNSKL